MRKSKTTSLGNETIYQPQVYGANIIMKQLLWNETCVPHEARTPVMGSEPQSGKTSMISQLVYNFVKYCQKHGFTFQVIVLCGLPATDLREQTRKRMTLARSEDGRTCTGAELDTLIRSTHLAHYGNNEYDVDGLLVFNNSQKLKDVHLPTVDRRLVILDEAHLGNIKGSPIDTFLRNHGIKISEQIHTWDNNPTRNHLVCVSATPFAHTILSNEMPLQGDSLFRTLYVEPGEGYNSIAKMLKNGRIRQTEKIFDKHGEATTFLKERVIGYHTPGYVILRSVGRQHDSLVAFLRAADVTYKEFDGDNKNIHEIGSQLAIKPVTTVFVLIKGCMRAGMTLPDMSNVLAWVETPSVATDDAPAQSGVGRACGYGRTKDKFPIYCNVKAVREVAKFYADLRAGALTKVPKGRQNRGVEVDKEGRTTTADSRVSVVRIVSHAEGAKLAKESPGKRQRTDKDGKLRLWADTCSTKGNTATNVCARLLKGHSDGTMIHGMRVDGPPEKPKNPKTRWTPEKEAKLKEYQASYREMIEKHPDWEGRYLVYKYVNDKVTRNSSARDNSALRKD